MSTNLYWRPLPKNPDGEFLGYQLKFILAPCLWDHDGSLSAEWTTVGPDALDFLRGVAACGDKRGEEAQRLIDLIEKYGAVEIALMG